MEDVNVWYDPLHSIEIFNMKSIHHHKEMETIQQQYINQNENGEEMDAMIERNISMFMFQFDHWIDFANRMEHSSLTNALGEI